MFFIIIIIILYLYLDMLRAFEKLSDMFADRDELPEWPDSDWRGALRKSRSVYEWRYAAANPWCNLFYTGLFDGVPVEDQLWPGDDVEEVEWLYSERIWSWNGPMGKFTRERFSVGVNVCYTDFTMGGDPHERTEVQWRKLYPIRTGQVPADPHWRRALTDPEARESGSESEGHETDEEDYSTDLDEGGTDESDESETMQRYFDHAEFCEPLFDSDTD